MKILKELDELTAAEVISPEVAERIRHYAEQLDLRIQFHALLAVVALRLHQLVVLLDLHLVLRLDLRLRTHLQRTRRDFRHSVHIHAISLLSL